MSERAIPLQGIYSASKHAFKSSTDALRLKLEEEGAPVSVTLVKLGTIDTPFPLNAKNHLETKPQHVTAGQSASPSVAITKDTWPNSVSTHKRHCIRCWPARRYWLRTKRVVSAARLRGLDN